MTLRPQPERAEHIRALQEELANVEGEIARAYWAFTRQARAKPPSLAVPRAYRRRREILEELRARSVSVPGREIAVAPIRLECVS